jgi:IS5 family transposase
MGISMSQITFSQVEYAGKKKLTRRDKFLAEMNAVIPWERLMAVVAPVYPQGKRGRPPIGLGRMMRMYFVQQWYTLADEALEDAIYDSQALRDFIGIDLVAEQVPDATTLLRFRRLLEEHRLTRELLTEINAYLEEKGLLLKQGTLVDATLIAAPPSTKNREKQRDPEMHQTKKGNQWYFGMKAHIGVDMETGVVHSVHCTAANESDVSHAHEVLHGDEKSVHLDAGYTGVAKRDEHKNRDVKWFVAGKRGEIAALPEGEYKKAAKSLEKAKAQIRAFVEHPFHVVKDLFGYRKVSYRGLAKNDARMQILFGLANIYRVRKALMV